MIQIPDEHKRKILKSYLGRYCTPLTKEEREQFKALFPSIKTCMVIDKPSVLKKVGAYHLLAWGYIQNRQILTYDIIETFLGHSEEESFYDVFTGLLIIYHMRDTMENKQLENLTRHTIESRLFHQKPTLLLSECSLPKLEATVPIVKITKSKQDTEEI